MTNNYLKRKIDAFLLDWKNTPNKKPLIVKGCRQIGKTESIRHFAISAGYESFIEINFVKDQKYKNRITDGYETNQIIKRICIETTISNLKRFVQWSSPMLMGMV